MSTFKYAVFSSASTVTSLTPTMAVNFLARTSVYVDLSTSSLFKFNDIIKLLT